MNGRCLPGYVSGTKGWVCRVAEKAVIELVLIADLTSKKCGQAHDLVDNKDKFSYGKAMHLCRVYQIVVVTPCSGKGTANTAGKELHEVLVNL